MLSRREEFFQDVRRAVRLEQQPKATTDSDLLSEERISQALRGSSLWLTPKVVEKYAPDDFNECTVDQREWLETAVTEFRLTAGGVASNSISTRDQFALALAAFRTLTAIVREIILDEWTRSAGIMLSNVKKWSDDCGWRSRVVDRKANEALLGTYSMEQLQVFADSDLYVFEPLARFVSGAAGAYDLSIQPSCHTATLYRDYEDHWHVHLNGGQGTPGDGRDLWNREAFRKSLDDLRALV